MSFYPVGCLDCFTPRFLRIIRGTFFLLCLIFSSSIGMILIPMDEKQRDHLKSYGVVYHGLKNGVKSYWLLNYRGGSFLCEESRKVELKARQAGVTIESISAADFGTILKTMEESNMEKVTLEKAPAIAVYTPANKLPWDDAVTMALEYAEIPYEKIYDKEVVTGQLSKYDWLHLHHEDFTGQYSKFLSAFGSAPWYQQQKSESEKMAKSLGFRNVPECKKAVALAILQYVNGGGFLFAMCNAANTLDIALAALGTDIVDTPYDGTSIDKDYEKKLDYSNCFAFENFSIETSPLVQYFDNIDVNRVNTPERQPVFDFRLFAFSAKLDPVPTMLTQNHTPVVRGFYGLLTSFNRAVIKKSVVILGDTPGTNQVKYIHGIKGKGQFAFLGGHDPEDQEHLVGDVETVLGLHKNSPGYRLILNNALFPAAEKKEKKT